MSVFRIEKNKNYTVMSNHHLRNKELSLKSKGLLSLMLSLPEEWDYTLKGLSIIIIITPESQQPMLEKPTLENPTQRNKDKTITEELNTDCIKYQSINPSEQTNSDERLIERYNKTKSEIKAQIDYDTLILSNNEDIINDIVEVMTDVMVVDTKYYVIGKKEIPAELVKILYKQHNCGKIEALLLDLNDVTHLIRSKTPYLMSALYNAANTGETSMTNRVRHDMYGI